MPVSIAVVLVSAALSTVLVLVIIALVLVITALVLLSTALVNCFFSIEFLSVSHIIPHYIFLSFTFILFTCIFLFVTIHLPYLFPLLSYCFPHFCLLSIPLSSFSVGALLSFIFSTSSSFFHTFYAF